MIPNLRYLGPYLDEVFYMPPAQLVNLTPHGFEIHHRANVPVLRSMQGREVFEGLEAGVDDREAGIR